MSYQLLSLPRFALTFGLLGIALEIITWFWKSGPRPCYSLSFPPFPREGTPYCPILSVTAFLIVFSQLFSLQSGCELPSSSLWVQFSHSVVSNSLRHHGCSTPGFPVHHQMLELAQTHVHQVGDDIQQSHPLLSPSPPAFNLSQSESFPMSQLFTSGGQSIGVSASASVLPMNIQD